MEVMLVVVVYFDPTTLQVVPFLIMSPERLWHCIEMPVRTDERNILPSLEFYLPLASLCEPF